MMKDSVNTGKIPDVEALSALCTEENPRPALQAACRDERKRVAAAAKAAAEAAVAKAEEAAAAAGGDA
jgi:hypothetical protein